MSAVRSSTVLDGQKQSYGTVGDLAACLVKAHRSGRPIIPVVGAGISADSGFPVLVSIVRYFGKIRLLLKRQLWLRRADRSDEDPLRDLQEKYLAEPWKYVRDFGWPDRFQLNADILASSNNFASRSMGLAVNRGLENLLDSSSQNWRMQTFHKMRDDLVEKLRQLEVETSAFAPSLKKSLLNQIASIRHRLEENDGRSVPWDLFGDWKRMILDFTNFQSDYADALLARFARDHEPNLAHRYLAFLIRRFNVPVIFTMNFDPFIEQVLHEEDLRPRTFSMEHGLTLPHDSLVREQLAVIKMHGSTHALLLDEQLDRPLNPDYLDRFVKIVGKNPLLLVIGCSGEDNRLLNLVQQVLRRKEAAPIQNEPRVAWIHYEPEPPANVRALCRADAPEEGRLRFRRTKNIGGTLMHLYSANDRLHPASRKFYLTHFQQPVLLEDSPASATLPPTSADKDAWMKQHMPDLFKKALKRRQKFFLLESIIPRGATVPPPDRSGCYPDPSASRQLLWLGSSLPPGYNLIWVDLEAVHTLSAVAGSIVDQCRKYDSTLVPCVLPQDADIRPPGDPKAEELLAKALERVVRALRRSRYFVAFDGLETYVWSPTAHHGDTHSTERAGGVGRLNRLIEFLEKLAEKKLGESCFAASVDFPRPRTDFRSDAAKELPAKIEALIHSAKDEKTSAVLDWNAFSEAAANASKKESKPYEALVRDFPRYEDRFAGVAVEDGRAITLRGVKGWTTNPHLSRALALSVLAAFRRTRPLPLVHQVLRPILGEGEVEPFLAEMQRAGFLRQLEGGGIWFYREVRDHLYAQNTGKTNTDRMKDCLVDHSTADYGDTIFQLLLNTLTHQMVARTWYASAFVQSHDTFALLEYFYHRLASVRILTKLIGLLENPGIDEAERRAALQEGMHTLRAAVTATSDPAGVLRAFEVDEGFLDFKSDNQALNHIPDPLERFRLYLAWRHGEELRRLLYVWRKSETILRAQVPAEQILRWCEQFLDDDLQRCYSVVTGYPTVGASGPDAYIVHCLSIASPDPAVTKRRPCREIEELRGYIEDFNAKILMDRSDYEGCKELRAQRFKADPAAGPGTIYDHVHAFLQRVSDRSLQPQAGVPIGAEELARNIRWAHHWVDIVGCELRIAQESLDRTKIFAHEATQCTDKLQKWSDVGTVQLDNSECAGLRELQLRALHFLTNGLFRRACIFSHAGFSGDPAKQTECAEVLDERNLEAAKRYIDKGTLIARLQSQPQTTAPHSATVNAVVDGTLYLPYRGIFLIQQARWRWLSALRRHYGAPPMPGASAALLQEMDESLCEFEKARAGLSGTNQLTLALSDLHAAEVCLVHARVTLKFGAAFPGGKPLENIDCFDLARSRYETARGLLARARVALMGAQRNVIWWRFFFQLTTQYHADRLMLGAANLVRLNFADPQSVQPNVAKLGSYLLRLRKGYASLKSAHDLYLNHPGSDVLQWLPRLERELSLAGFAVGLLAWRLRDTAALLVGGSPPTPKAEKTVYLCQQLWWLMQTAGLDVGEKPNEKEIKISGLNEGHFDRFYEDIHAVFGPGAGTSTSPEEAARKMRDGVIQTAMI